MIFRSSSGAILVSGARGGHGATTVAGAIGQICGLPVVSHEPDALRWLWSGSEVAALQPSVYIRDVGVIGDHSDHPTPMIAVLRGPCSLGLRSLAREAEAIDHVVLIREPWRPIRREDVEAALSTVVVAEIAHSPRVARLADAGLLRARVPELDEFDELKEWARSQWQVSPRDSQTPQFRAIGHE